MTLVNGFVLLLVANGAPVLAGALTGGGTAKPIDGGLRLIDGRAVFGASKTWRGLFAAFAATTAVTHWMGYGMVTGMIFAFGAMTGDLLASFCKRRLGRRESSHFRWLDTVPESFLPLLMVKSNLVIGWLDIAVLVGAFYLIEKWSSPLLYKWHLRKQP